MQCPFKMCYMLLTGHSEGDLLCSAPSLILSHAGVGARIALLCWTEDKIQDILVHSALSGDPLASSLPPNLRGRCAPRGKTGHPLQSVCFENL